MPRPIIMTSYDVRAAPSYSRSKQLASVRLARAETRRKLRSERCANIAAFFSDRDPPPLTKKEYARNLGTVHENRVHIQSIDAEATVKGEAEAKAQAEAEAKTQAEAEATSKVEADAKAQAEAEAKARMEAEAKAKVEAEATAMAEAEAKAQAEAEVKARAAAEAKAVRQEDSQPNAAATDVGEDEKVETGAWKAGRIDVLLEEGKLEEAIKAGWQGTQEHYDLLIGNTHGAITLDLTVRRDEGGVGIFLDEDKGAPIVDEVVDNSPADSAGIRANDIICAVQGRAVFSLGAVVLAIGQSASQHSEVAIRLRRDGSNGAEVTPDARAGRSTTVRPERLSRL